MQRLLAEEFERQGWTYDLATVPRILEEVSQTGTGDPQRLAAQVPADFLARSGTTRAQVADAIGRAIGGKVLEIERDAGTTLVFNDHSITLGAGAHVSGGNLNTGSQVVVQANSDKADVLTAVAALVTAGLQGEWSPEAASELAQLIDSRADITVEDVRDTTVQAAEEVGSEPGRVQTLLTQIATGAMSGALGTGISAGLGSLF